MTRTTIMPTTAVPLMLALMSSGCDEPPDLPQLVEFREMMEGPVVEGTWPPSGGTLNTAWLGETPLMRIALPSYPRDLCRDDDAYVEEIEVMVEGAYELGTSATANEGELVVRAANVDHRGAALVGSRWWLDAAKTHYITITEYGEADGRFGYQFEHQSLTQAIPDPVICEPDIDGDRWAYVVGNVSVDVADASISIDNHSLLVACASGALGKAISWGFAPWAYGYARDLKLYQTGVRTVMADYCGDGVSYTEDGVLIQVSNERAGQSFVYPETSTEAVFGPDGALCLTCPRIGGPDPACDIPACGSDAGAEALMNQSFHAWTKVAGS